MRIFAIIVSLSMLGIAGIVWASIPGGGWRQASTHPHIPFAKSEER